MQCVAPVCSPLRVSACSDCTSRLSHITSHTHAFTTPKQRTGSPHAPRVSRAATNHNVKTTARQQERRRTHAFICRLSTCAQDYKPPEQLPGVQTEACTRAASSDPWPHRRPLVSPPQDGRITAAQRQPLPPLPSQLPASTNGALSGTAQGAAHAAPLPPVLWLAQCFSSAFLYSGTLFQSAAACPLRGLSKLGSPSKL